MKHSAKHMAQFHRHRDALEAILGARKSASASSLSRASGVPLKDVQAIMHSKGVSDDDQRV